MPTEMILWDSPCGMYIPTEMFFLGLPCGMYIPMKMIGFRCLARSHMAPVCVPGGPIPDDFWVVWEGPPYRPHSLGDGSKCRCRKGLKTVCLGPTRTSAWGRSPNPYTLATLGGGHRYPSNCSGRSPQPNWRPRRLPGALHHND